MNNIENRAKKVIAEQLGVNVANITLATDVITEFNTDSLDEIELIMALEDEFSIELPDEACEGVRTVQQAIDLVARHSPGEAA